MVGVPNKRLRYFLLARRKRADKQAEDGEQEGLYSERGVVQTEWPLHWPSEECGHSGDEAVAVDPISTFLDSEVDPSTAVPEKWIRKTFKFNFDVVSPHSTRSTTFTKAYGSHHIYGSGSLFVPNDIAGAPAAEPHYINDADELLSLHPRFFSPTEVARLHSFPESLSFPDNVSAAQWYRLLGNSLNCKLVGELMKKLFQ
ncbi:S-adenosyl-L-methionine-dependent methyltransferase [Catenaria anguillulae PL171]|uniref:S-adenosyl-L-methionine-dependent methyltransferase n=1 Tax=Catenaria anguillulae PL171 TaxID=765915 RepID=A0A1Y2HCR0_9FUNG|nr:S-adenosyl-L-methionine-dependent methyltransferase [Catenaria anguillulae PL171]